MKALIGTIRKEAVVKVTCWEPKSHLFKATVLPTFTHGIEIWGGNSKNSQWKSFEKGIKVPYDVPHQSAFFDNLPYFVG